MGNKCGRSTRYRTNSRLPRKEKRGALKNADIERRQLSRAEKYKFFQAIRDEPEDDVILFMKDNPWVLSSTFWFETDRCSCSKDFELGTRESITNTEMMARIGLCINTAMCPHVLLKKNGFTVSTDQDVSFDDISKFQADEQHLKSVRYSRKLTAGFYWIHLAIFFGKDKLIEEMLSISCHLTDIGLVTLYHKISPVLIAILHGKKSIVKVLGRMHPTLIWHESQNINAETDGLTQDAEKFNNAFMWTLACNQFEDFLLLWTLAQNSTESSWIIFKRRKILPVWEDKLHRAIVRDNKHHIDGLTKVKGVYIQNYSSLLSSLQNSGCSSGCKIIVEKTDFCKQFLTREHFKIHKYLANYKIYLAQIISREAFLGKEENVKFLIDHGFDVNAQLEGGSLLTWTEALNERTISKLLVTAGAKREPRTEERSLIHAALDLNHHSFNEMDTLYVVHKLYQNGFRLFESDRTVLKAYRRSQYGICKYMLLRGEEPYDLLTGAYQNFIWNFLYLVTTSNLEVTFMKVLRKDSFVFVFRELFEMLSILPEVANKSGIEDLVSSESMEWISTHLIPRTPNNIYIRWFSCVRSLQSLCRGALSSNFKRFRYLRYLKLIKEQIPKTLYMYLEKDDIIQVISKHISLDQHERELQYVDDYFLRNI